MFFSLREIKSSLKRYFSPDFTCKAIFITNLMFYKVVDAILLFVGKENANERKESLLLICRVQLFFCKENANERKESLLSICRVQLFFCKETTFPRNFQGFGEKCRDDDNAKRRLPELRVAC